MIFQNLRAPLNPIHRATAARAVEPLRAVGIPDPARRASIYPFELSGGMYQRVVIARAVSGRPARLIADEPTTGIDVTTQAVFMDLLGQLAADTGMATLLITHDLALAAERAGRIAVMHAGHVVEEAPTRRLIAAPAPPTPAASWPRRPPPPTASRTCTASPAPCPTCAGPTCRSAATAAAASAAAPSATASYPRSPSPPPTPSPAGIRHDERAAGHGRDQQAVPGRRPWLRRAHRPEAHAVDDVSLTLKRGETLGLVGESGCGKSTLVRMLARLLDPTAGSMRLGGRELPLHPARRFARDPDRARVQVVLQDADEGINPRFIAADAIADPLRRLGGLRGAALRSAVGRAAAQYGLEPALLPRFPHQLSGGQRPASASPARSAPARTC